MPARAAVACFLNLLWLSNLFTALMKSVPCLSITRTFETSCFILRN